MSEQDARIQLVEALNANRGCVLVVAHAIVADPALAEDVYQEVSLELSRQWDAVRAMGSISGWMRAVARNKALQALQRRGRVTLLSHRAMDLLASGPAGQEPLDAGRRTRVRECLDKLPDHMRLVVNQRYRDERTCTEIASRTGRSVQAVYSLLKRAKLALAACIDRARGSSVGSSA